LQRFKDLLCRQRHIKMAQPKGSQGVQPAADAVAGILKAIKERRAL
jgi:hypothetical protein